MVIGEVKTKSGVSYGTLTSDNIDLNADSKTFFTMYSAIMHDVKRYGYKEAYELWTREYDKLIVDAEFAGKQYCLRAGEAIRYYCAQQAGIPFKEKYVLSADSKWVVDWLYLKETSEGVQFDVEFSSDLCNEIASVEECFACYKIAFAEVDVAL